MARFTIAQERMYLTSDRKRVVAEGDKRAATLYAAPGHRIPAEAAERFGLSDGFVKGSAAQKAAAKEKKVPADKERKAGDDKSGNTSVDDLTAIKGIGAATARVLGTAGLGSFTALAEVDPNDPPEVAGLGATADWAGWTAAAMAMTEGTA